MDPRKDSGYKVKREPEELDLQPVSKKVKKENANLDTPRRSVKVEHVKQEPKLEEPNSNFKKEEDTNCSFKKESINLDSHIKKEHIKKEGKQELKLQKPNDLNKQGDTNSVYYVKFRRTQHSLASNNWFKALYVLIRDCPGTLSEMKQSDRRICFEFHEKLRKWRQNEIKSDLIVEINSVEVDMSRYFANKKNDVANDPKGDTAFGKNVKLKWATASAAESYLERTSVNRKLESHASVQSCYATFRRASLDMQMHCFIESAMRREYIGKFMLRLGIAKLPKDDFEFYCTPARIKEVMQRAKGIKTSEAKTIVKDQFKELDESDRKQYTDLRNAVLGFIDNYIQSRSLNDLIFYDQAPLLACSSLESMLEFFRPPVPEEDILGFTITPQWSSIDARSSFIEDAGRSSVSLKCATDMWEDLSISSKAAHFQIAYYKRQFIRKMRAGKKLEELEEDYKKALADFKEIFLLTTDFPNTKTADDVTELRFVALPKGIKDLLKVKPVIGVSNYLAKTKKKVAEFYDIVEVEGRE